MRPPYWIAFYADCRHKLEKVTSGYRVAMTFNLMLSEPAEVIPDKNENELCCAIREYFSDDKLERHRYSRSPTWFVYLLNHQYTPRSLNWKMLKGVDKQTAGELKEVAKILDLEIYLTLAEVQETWNAQETNRGYYRRRSRDFDEDEDYEVEELICTETSLTNWLNSDGDAAPFEQRNRRNPLPQA